MKNINYIYGNSVKKADKENYYVSLTLIHEMR